ncbi:hypothetical protein Ciccas_013971, partial [Cichlidogyrus casuarinus]
KCWIDNRLLKSNSEGRLEKALMARSGAKNEQCEECYINNNEEQRDEDEVGSGVQVERAGMG